MLMNRAAILALCVGGTAMGQSIVSFESMGWKDFGTTTQTNLGGNFLPGWLALQATPDIGVNVFGGPNQSLSGASDDAAVWLNEFDLNGTSAASNEVVYLSLSGFSVGETYNLSFFATILQHSSFGWIGNDDALEVELTGADISQWSSSVLHDDVDNDGMNTWAAQSLVFTAMNSTVNFSFGENASAIDIGGSAYRMGIDGFDIAVVPSPSALGLLGLGGLMAGRRRR